MIHPTVALHFSQTNGWGVFATERMSAGTVVWAPCLECSRWSNDEVRELSPPQYKYIHEKGYHLADRGMILPCGGGGFLNHSCQSNVLDFGLDFGVALQDIDAGEEITIDYGAFLYDIPWEFSCACHQANCRGSITSRDGLSLQLVKTWKQRLQPVLAQVSLTPQPLGLALEKNSACYRSLKAGFETASFRWQYSICTPGFLCDDAHQGRKD